MLNIVAVWMEWSATRNCKELSWKCWKKCLNVGANSWLTDCECLLRCWKYFTKFTDKSSQHLQSREHLHNKRQVHSMKALWWKFWESSDSGYKWNQVTCWSGMYILWMVWFERVCLCNYEMKVGDMQTLNIVKTSVHTYDYDGKLVSALIQNYRNWE